MKKIILLMWMLALTVPAFAGECKVHIELLPAATLAEEYGKDESWVHENIKVYLWDNPTFEGKGKRVGKMYPGSRAVILLEGEKDYKVRSPLDRSVGWVSKSQVSRTLLLDTETKKPCGNGLGETDGKLQTGPSRTSQPLRIPIRRPSP